VDWNFELIAGPFGDAVDGPVWDGQALLFSRVGAGELLRYDVETRQVSAVRRFTIRTTGLALGPEGQLYGAQSGARRIVQFKEDGSTVYLGVKLAGQYHNHPHDLTVDRRGRIWFSDPYSPIRTRGPQVFPPLDHASVLRLDFEAPPRVWVIKRMTYDTAEPRGLALSPDERMLYVAESNASAEGKRELRAYPIRDDGTLGPPSVLHTFGVDHRGLQRGAAGMTVDSAGNIIVCAGSSASGPGPLVYVFQPSGRVLETHPVPEGDPTNCAFGGMDLDRLFVTTSNGSLYQVRSPGRQGFKR
jgi:gluconolactonase